MSHESGMGGQSPETGIHIRIRYLVLTEGQVQPLQPLPATPKAANITILAAAQALVAISAYIKIKQKK